MSLPIGSMHGLSNRHDHWCGSGRRRVLATAVALLAVLGIVVATAPASSASPESEPVLGTYSGEILGQPDADGVRHIDVNATIAALKAANVNAFAYVIYGYGVANTAAYPEWSPERVHTVAAKVTQAQWDALPGFLAAAQAEGIEVWAYLVPPSESAASYEESTYAPFYWDYPGWASHIGQVAAAHTNLRAIVIDDFGGNTVEAGNPWTFKFTTGNVAAMRTAARTHAPWMKILPGLYYCQFHNNEGTLSGLGWPKSTSSTYRGVVDGYIGVYNGSPSCTWWSGDGTPPPNTTDPSLAEDHYRFESSMIKCDAGAGCLELGVPADTPTRTGSWTAAKQQIRVADGGSYSLSFATNDDWTGASAGHHKLQVLVDGDVVWQEDVAGYHGWHTSTVDLTAALEGKTEATLTLRLYEATGVSNMPVAAWFDSLATEGFTLTNPNFDTSLTGWTRSQSAAAFKQKWAPSLDYVPMTYAARLADIEPDPTTAAYAVEVATKALQLYDEGLSDGVILYNMNLTGAPNGLGDPATLGEIADLYSAY